MIETPDALDPPEPDNGGEPWHRESDFECRYGHGKLIEFPELVVFPVAPPWPVKPTATADPTAPNQPAVNPPHLRMRVHYCEHCTYTELHYVRDEA